RWNLYLLTVWGGQCELDCSFNLCGHLLTGPFKPYIDSLRPFDTYFYGLWLFPWRSQRGLIKLDDDLFNLWLPGQYLGNRDNAALG
ncbi:MAG TPA: hypothetical protein VLQ80_26490, partial [Candidatus Saccharimonadia bacterium]|nr:hypothetical protein [Candidatus Saccharimonadia bacterium]